MCPRYQFNIRSKGQRSKSQGHKLHNHIEDDRVGGIPFNIRSKGQRSKSQGHKLQNHIEDDRVGGMSLHSIE